MLKADHQSQHYRLEDDLLKRYPEQIISVKERIEGIKKDAALYAAESKKTLDVLPGADVGAAAVSTKFPGMTVDGVTYDEKEPAAKALLDSCKTVTNKLEKEIGEYMGFKMSLRLEGMTTDKKFHLLLRANMTYQIELGADSFGNITRINNALADLPKKLEGAQLQLETLLSQQEAAKQELEKPFALTDELSEKETRLALLNAELNIEGSGGMDVVNDPDTRADAAKERYEDSDYDDDYEPDENDIDGGERKPFTLVNPGMTFHYPPEQERRVAYGKTKPPLMEAIRNYNAEKKPPVPGRKSSEHDI
jgi:hypothetical protein